MIETPSSYSSVQHSETSPTAPNVTASQKGIHAAKWDDWRAIIRELLRTADEDLQRRATKIAACACSPVLCLAGNARLRLAPGYCRDRLCPTCAARRSRRTFHQLRHAVDRMDSPRFATFTLRHKAEPLFLTLARLRAGFAQLRRNPHWQRSVTGGVYSVEVKRNAETGHWHAHIHAIIDGAFIAQKLLSECWKTATGDSFIVDIRAIHSRKSTVSYITKYISKPADLASFPTAAIAEYARDMASVRCVQSFGNAHNTKGDPGDDGCVVEQVEPLTSTHRILMRVEKGCRRAADAITLLNRLGPQFRRALGLPRPPEDDEPMPLLQAEYEELVDTLRWLGQVTQVADIPDAVWRQKRATLRVDECPWP